MKQLKKTKEKRGGFRGGRAVSAVLFAFFVLIAGFFPEMAGTAYGAKEPEISLSVSYGFGDTAKGDRYLPVRISLDNTGTEEFTGTAEVLTTASSMEVYRYDYQIKAPAKANSEFVFYIPLGIKGDQLFITLKDSNGNEIEKRRLKLTISNDVVEIFTGVFSDSLERLEYLNEVGVHYGSLKTKLLHLNKDSAPESALGYDQLDLILISDYDLNRLTEKQQDAIMQWVEAGGILLFGGGSRYRENMGQFASELLETTDVTPVKAAVNLGIEYSQNTPQDSVLELICADSGLKNGSALISGDEYPLLSFTHRKKGRIAAACFDLGDIKEFCQTRPSFIENVLTLVMGELKIQELSQMDYAGFSRLYFSVQGLVNTGNVDRLPNVILYTIVISVYILIIGPVLYLYLKKKSLQRFYIGGVIGCSLIFTAVIYIMGVKTRFKTPFFTYAAILNTSEGEGEEEIFINVRSPLNKPYMVELNPEYTVRPITKSYYYDSLSTAKFTGEEGYKTAISHKRDKTELRIRDTAAFTPKLFSLKKQIRNDRNVGIEGNAVHFDEEISGTIVNHFDYPLKGAALILYGKAVLIGDMEPGQAINLADKKTVNYPLNYTYALSKMITGADQYEKTDISDTQYMLSQERTRLLSFYIDQNIEEYVPDARLIAFRPNKNEADFINGGNYITEGLTMITASVTVNRERDGRIYRSALEQEPNIISGNYQARFNSMYTGEPSEPAVIEYSLGNDLKIEQVVFEYLSPEFQDNLKYPYLGVFQGKIYFYNYNTGHNDLMEMSRTSYTIDELKPYLSPSNTITIKYVNEGTGEYGWDKLLPMIYVIGREK